MHIPYYWITSDNSLFSSKPQHIAVLLLQIPEIFSSLTWIPIGKEYMIDLLSLLVLFQPLLFAKAHI